MICDCPNCEKRYQIPAGYERRTATCKQCGTRFRPQGDKDGNPRLVSAILSFLVPGLGQAYRGHHAHAWAWFFGTIVGYCLMVLPGLVAHLACVYNAATTD